MIASISLKSADTVGVVKAGRLLAAVAIVGLGAEHILFEDFITGRAPAWPASLPGKLAWAYGTGALLMASGIAMMTGKRARLMLMISALFVFGWALLRHVPVLANDVRWGSELTKMGKALTMCGGLLAAAAGLPKDHSLRAVSMRKLINSSDAFVIVGRVCLAVFMIICGIEHFIFVDFIQHLVPAWIPGPVFWTCFAGVALIAGGIGLLITRTARLAATLTGLMIFLWFVLLHVPRAIAAGYDPNEWIAVCEALAFSGFAFTMVRRYN